MKYFFIRYFFLRFIINLFKKKKRLISHETVFFFFFFFQDVKLTFRQIPLTIANVFFLLTRVKSYDISFNYRWFPLDWTHVTRFARANNIFFNPSSIYKRRKIENLIERESFSDLSLITRHNIYFKRFD